jgi:hypothetical protein
MVCAGNAAHSLSDNFGVGRHTTTKLTDHRGGTTTTCYDFTPTYNIVELKKFPLLRFRPIPDEIPEHMQVEANKCDR